MHRIATQLAIVLACCYCLPQLRWDMSSCPDEPYRAEDRDIIVVSRSYPTKIGQNWTCIYNFFTPDKTQRIVVEFDDFLFESCSLQNLTISDDETGRKVGPYCNSQVPPKFVSDSDKITIATYTGDLEHEANSRGYMFKFKRISETEANQLKQEMTMQEFNQADYMDYNMFGMGMRPGMRPGMGHGMRPGMSMGGMGPGGMMAGNRPMGNGMGMYPGMGQGRRRTVLEKPSVQPLPEFNSTYSRNVPRRTRVVEKIDNDYTHGNSAAYPVGTPLGPPLPPDLPANLPGGKSNYIQPGYANQIVPDWVDEEEEDSDTDFQWTLPKIVGIAAGALCIIAIVAVGIQQHLRRAELKIAKEIAMATRRGSGDSETSFSSFDSEAEERERRRVKRQIKKEKRNQKSDANSIISDEDKPKRRKKRTKYSESRAMPDDRPSGGTSSRGQTGGSRNFTEQDLAKAGLEMQRQKLQAKLQKYI